MQVQLRIAWWGAWFFAEVRHSAKPAIIEMCRSVAKPDGVLRVNDQARAVRMPAPETYGGARRS